MEVPMQSRLSSASEPTNRAEKGHQDWRALFRSVEREHGFVPLRVEGRLPEGLRGTLYRNGPGVFTSPEGHARHPFDGEGALSAVRFEAGQALGAVRVIDTKARREEQARHKSLYSGYDYHAPGLLRFAQHLKPNANTHVVPWRGVLLALWEGARPVAVCPDSLETLGSLDPSGAIPSAFSAHPHRVESRNALYNFGVRNRMTARGVQATLDLFELPDAGPARRLAELPLGRPTMVHDFIATERHFVFFLGPIELDVKGVLSTARSISQSLRFRPERGTEILVVPIDAPEQVVRFETEAFHLWHFANAYEGERGPVVSFVRFPNLDSLEGLSRLWQGQAATGYDGQLYRAELDLGARRVQFSVVTERYCEFPRVHPRFESTCARFVYTSAFASHAQARARGLHGSIARTELETGKETCFHFDDREQVSEPVFVPRAHDSDEEDGFVLALVANLVRRQSYLAVFIASKLTDGPCARVHFEQLLPMSFHGSFVPPR